MWKEQLSLGLSKTFGTPVLSIQLPCVMLEKAQENRVPIERSAESSASKLLKKVHAES